MEEIIGGIAATLTTISFIPQVIKILKTRHTSDISLLMYIGFTLGVSLWLCYGIMIDRPPVIAANAITLIFSGIILYVKVKEG